MNIQELAQTQYSTEGPAPLVRQVAHTLIPSLPGVDFAYCGLVSQIV